MKNLLKKIIPIALFILLTVQASSYSSAYEKDALTNNFLCNVSAKTESCSRALFLKSWKTAKDEYVDTSMNKQNWYYWKDRYLDKIKTKADAYVAIDSMIESLDDPYTRFLRPEDFEDQNISIDANITGIGVNITSVGGKTVVIDVIEGAPAQKSGLESGDIITKVNGTSINGYPLRKVASMVRGKAGSSVTLQLLRNKKPIEKVVVRENFDIKSVNQKIIDKNIAYIRINSFIGQDTAKEVANAIIKTEKAKGIIIDLRGNHGGLLQNAILISSMFMDKGKIVSIVGKDKNRKDIDATSIGLYTDKPLVVLINKGSASASEILSGALHDNKRADLIGETSFGKGLVQKVIPLSKDTGMNVTVAKYLTPNGTDINKKGIEPDYKVKLTKEDFLANKDPQLDKAKEVLKKQMNSIAYTGKN